MNRYPSAAAKRVAFARCLVPICATLWLAASAAEPSPAAAKSVPCDWLQEVKRTNTWFERDQESRKTAILLQQGKHRGEPVSDQQIADAWRAAELNDKILQGELDDLVARCGWPTTSGYGDKAPQYAAFIVQHADLAYQERYLPMMQAAADAGELAQRHVAMLVDRILMYKKLPQRYGTQLTGKDGQLVVYPIEDPEGLDARRAAVGMVPTSFCAYIARFEPTPQSELCKK